MMEFHYFIIVHYDSVMHVASGVFAYCFSFLLNKNDQSIHNVLHYKAVHGINTLCV